MNQFDEFTASPQSGSVKTSRTWYTSVLNSKITNDKSQGIWFDQSNYSTVVANNYIDNNTGSGLFFEISAHLYAVDNFIRTVGGARAVKLAGSSNLYFVNNTAIGGSDPVGVYTDARSIPGCSDPAQPSCSEFGGSDKDTFHTHLASMTWIPTIDMFVNNIMAYPTSTGYCGSTTSLCITLHNATATVAIQTVIHPASTGVPQTIINGNVYANGSGNAIVAATFGNYPTTSSFANAMAGSPVNISGLESNGLVGNSYVNPDGTATSALSSLHGSAFPVPVDSTVNLYIPAGTKHYGTTWR